MEKRLSVVLGTGKCIVDVGCGSGQLLTDLVGRFEQRISLDISRHRLELAGRKIKSWKFRETDLNDRFPLEDGCADVVLANQVIEHIIDPVNFASEIYRLLRPGGCCVITTPNIRYFQNIAHILFTGYGPRTAGGNTLDGVWDDGHIHYFTHRDLRELFTQVGFSRVQSSALVDTSSNTLIRRWMDRYASIWPIREVLSGNILLWADR